MWVLVGRRWSRLRGHFHRRQRPLILALAVGALRHPSGFEPLLDQVARSAIRTLLGDGFAPRHEVAFRIPAAAIEGFATFGAPLHHFALRAIRTGHADSLLLDEFALRIIAARRELAEAPVLHHQIVAALRALLIQWHVRLLLFCADLLGGLAVRISGAC